jgi:hypothetical protein
VAAVATKKATRQSTSPPNSIVNWTKIPARNAQPHAASPKRILAAFNTCDTFGLHSCGKTATGHSNMPGIVVGAIGTLA